MGAAVVRVRKSKTKRQVVSDIADERKSSNCPFILAREILGILCWEVGLSRLLRQILIQTVKMEWVIRGRRAEEKRPSTSCLILLLCLSRCLRVSLTKFYEVVLDQVKTLQLNHTQRLLLCLFPFLCFTHTCACTDTHTHTQCVGYFQG